MRTSAEYLQLFKSLMPKGKFWNLEAGTVFEQVLQAKSDEFQRVEEQSENLITESHVTTTDVLVSYHEEDYGLPKYGIDIADTIEQRRTDLHAKLLEVGAQYPEYFIEIIERFGYTVTIEQFTPLWADYGKIGDYVADWFTIFWWFIYFSLKGNKGEFDRSFNTPEFNRLEYNDRNYFKTIPSLDITRPLLFLREDHPAHTLFQARFSDIEFTRAFNRAFNSIPYYDGTCEPGSFSREFGNGYANLRNYDGNFLTGQFSSAFNISFDSYHGKDFEFNAFSIEFRGPKGTAHGGDLEPI